MVKLASAPLSFWLHRGRLARSGGTIQSFTSASALADFIASLVDMKLEDKQLLLATLDVRERMDRLLVFLGQRIEVMRLTHKIEQETKGASTNSNVSFCCGSSSRPSSRSSARQRTSR